MKQIATFFTLITCSWALTSCSTINLGREKTPEPEKSKSNSSNTVEWVKTESDPPVFVPKEMDEKMAKNAETGEWFLDRSSGASYFVPFNGAGDARYDDVVSSLPGTLAQGSGVAPSPGIGEKIPSLDLGKVMPGKDKTKEG